MTVGSDMVSQFAFGKSLDALADPEFRSLPVRVFQQYLPSLHVIKAFPFVRWLNNLPLWIAKRISHAVEMGHELEQVSTIFFFQHKTRGSLITEFIQFASRRIDQYIDDKARGKGPSFPTIMERLLIPIPEKGYQVPSKTGLRDEILTTVSAGDDTTGIANMVTIFNIVNSPEIHSRLLEELKSVMPSPQSHVPYLELEQLPYLVRKLAAGPYF